MSPFLAQLTMMPSTGVSRLHTHFAIHNAATAASKSPRVDAAAVLPCRCRVLAAAPDESLATLNFAEFLFHALR